MITDQELERLRARVESTLPDFLADLQQLVNIDCGSYSKHGVDSVGTWVRDRLSQSRR